jgi:Mlc titration factor MtfA (ptsG expression regulator)
VFGDWQRAWQRRRETAALRRRAIPDDLWKRTLVRFPFLRRADDPGAQQLRRLTSLFLDGKEFSAAGGLRLTDAVVVAIAAQACLPVLRLGLAAYDGFVGIVVHPDQVCAPREAVDEAGVVHRYHEALAGESVAGGPVMLSWRDVRAAGRSRAGAYCVVIHEFAHVLDAAQGPTPALPILPPEIDAEDWQSLWQAAYAVFVAEVADGSAQVLDPYGVESLAEFFAVAVEAFFVTPGAMRRSHGALYDALQRYFGQDPAGSLPGHP